MKKYLFILPFFALFACGDNEVKTEEVKVVKVKSEKDKLSYSFGALESRKITDSKNENLARLDRDKILEGYKEGFASGIGQDQSDPCYQTLESLFGQRGMDFNELYLSEGSKCYGRFMAAQFYMQLESVSEVDRVNKDVLFKGFQEGLKGTDPAISKEEIESIIQAFDQEMQAKMMAEQEAQFGGNKVAGEEFLANNARKPGIITTASGLQYKVLKAGSGPVAKIGDQIAVHYTGTTLDDVKFDSSYDRNEPYPLTLPAQVITGWNEVLLLMKKGDKFEVYIPQELAYGATPRPGGPIEPFMVLKFEMEIMTLQATPNGQF